MYRVKSLLHQLRIRISPVRTPFRRRDPRTSGFSARCSRPGCYFGSGSYPESDFHLDGFPRISIGMGSRRVPDEKPLRSKEIAESTARKIRVDDESSARVLSINNRITTVLRQRSCNFSNSFASRFLVDENVNVSGRGRRGKGDTSCPNADEDGKCELFVPILVKAAARSRIKFTV